ncbi:hypothetical protein QQ045_027672 [Rhodiola kirilowii]
MPKAIAANDAKAAGTKAVASEVGLGAGASTAATFWTAEMDISTMTMATANFIFKASIVDEKIEIERELGFADGENSVVSGKKV